MRNRKTEHGFVALRLEGGILPAEFFQKVAALEAKKQKNADYRLAKGLGIRDEIGRAWRIAVAEWREFQEHIVRKDVDLYEIGVKNWLVTLLKQVLGFEELHPSGRISLADRSFPINYRAEKDCVPLVLTTADYSMDKSFPLFGEEGRKRSPHGLLQEYLNADETCLWGLVSNGLKIRLLRDNPSLTRPAFIEADLQRIFDEELFADFAAFWLIYHASRFAAIDGIPDHCALEEWRAEAHEVGERALANLRDGVTQALRELGNGFVQFQGNTELRTAMRDRSLTPMEFYQELLRLVYRFIFLFTAEDRDILHTPNINEDARSLYREGYSITRLREMALKRHHYDSYPDLWEGLQVAFRGLAQGADPLCLPALGGLFSEEQCQWLDAALIDNNRLLKAIYSLSFFRTGEVLARVNYHDMDTEELGSVYESLLELHPQVNVEAMPWTFSFAGDDTGGGVSGSERKLSGSYYTPDCLVQELIKSALDPVISRTLSENPQDPVGGLLRLKVVDPACGSGHFLLAAARRLASELARLEADTNQPDEALYRHCMRLVVQKCIYGVDLIPMAVELCKTALWLETIEPGMPLGFLDSHIRCGNSLVGVRDLKILDDGIPDDAYKPLSGDEKEIAASLKKDNRAAKQGQRGLFGGTFHPPTQIDDKFEELPEETSADIDRKKIAWQEALKAGDPERLACDIWTASFFAPKTAADRLQVPLSEDVEHAINGQQVTPSVVKSAHELAAKYRFFHWPLEFPKAFSKGGFDVVLGNPPWEVSQLSEEEYFSVYAPEIAELPGARRKAAINRLAQENPRLWQQYQNDKYAYDATNNFIRESGLFTLTAFGKLNTYSLFAEVSLKIISSNGSAGIIVPSGVASDDSNKVYFDEVTSKGRLASLFDFENREGIFQSVHRSFKFSLLTLGSLVEQSTFCCFAGNVQHLSDQRRRFTLSAEDIRLLNPNTKTSPVFRSQADAELTKNIYKRVPVLIKEGKGNSGNPWGITFRQGLFNMTSDSHLFRTYQQLSADGAELVGTVWHYQNGSRYLPLYEAKMMHQFDHRWATYEENGKDSRDVCMEEKRDQSYEPLPRYWVPEEDVEAALRDKGWERKWLFGWRDICRSTDERTVISSIIPNAGAGDTFLLMFPKVRDAGLCACLLADECSLVHDFMARQKIGGTHLKYHYKKQIVNLPPSAYRSANLDFIVPRVLELTYTSESLRPWAEDLDYQGDTFPWNPERRAQLRAELDAYYARLYGLSRDELRYILDPADVYGEDFPSETFRVLKNNEIREFGEYRTQRLVLEAWDRLEGKGL